MSDAAKLIDNILMGDLAIKAQGFMLVAPRGYRLEGLVEDALTRTYGTAGHPDIRRLSPEGAGDFIKVDAIRDAQSFLASTASGDGMKTLVLYRAHRMNTNAANALLKPLEEPTKATRIIIVTDNPAPLPSTIRSRCSVFPVSPNEDLAILELEALLAAEEIDTKEKPKALLTLADGDPALAAQIAQHKLSAWLKKIETWLAGDDASPPLPVLTGKTAVPLLTATMALQALFARASRADAALKGWTLDRTLNAGWKLVDRTTDITRAGIDARTRLHTMLLDIRAQ